MSDARARLAELGLTLPTVTPPLAAYIPAVQTGNHVYVSGQVPMVDGELLATRQGRRRGEPGAGQGAGPPVRAQRPRRGRLRSSASSASCRS